MFLDGYLGQNQIPIASTTCPYDTFAYKVMPFGLCNTRYFSIVYDVNLFRYCGAYHWSTHQWFFSIWLGMGLDLTLTLSFYRSMGILIVLKSNLMLNRKKCCFMVRKELFWSIWFHLGVLRLTKLKYTSSRSYLNLS